MLSIQSPGADVRKGEGGEVGPMGTKTDKGERGQFWQIFWGRPLWMTLLFDLP